MAKRVYVCKIIKFDAAHKLKNYIGLCGNLHGHTYRLEITVSGLIDKNGFVIDFKILKELIYKQIISKVDHRNLNDVLDISNTTAENIAEWIWDTLEIYIGKNYTKNDIKLEKVRIYETDNSYAEIRKTGSC